MDIKSIQIQVDKCLENIGIQTDYDKSKEYYIEDAIEDSITFISFIVELEQAFDITIPDEYLSMDMLETYNDIIYMIQQIIKEEV